MARTKLGQLLPQPYEPYAYVDEQFLKTLELLASQDLPAVGQFVMGVDERLKRKQYTEAAWDAVLIGAIAGYNLRKFGRDSAVAIAVALQIARHAVEKKRFRKGAGLKDVIADLGQAATTRIPYFEEAVLKPEYALTPGRARRELEAEATLFRQSFIKDKVNRAAGRTRAGIEALRSGNTASAIQHFERAFHHADDLEERAGETELAREIKGSLRSLMTKARTMSGLVCV